MALEFVKQMGLGALGGFLAGRALVWLVNHLNLETGLYPLLAAAGGVATYGLVTVAGGSGFLAIYLTGVILGNSQLQAMRDISRVSDGLAWLAQIMMFLLLGLLVTPSQFLPVALPALLVALALMLAARPIAVWVSVLPFRVPARPLVWAGAVCEALCIPFGIDPPLHRRRVEFWTKSRAFSIEKARRILGYEPRVDLDEGIARTAAAYR